MRQIFSRESASLRPIFTRESKEESPMEETGISGIVSDALGKTVEGAFNFPLAVAEFPGEAYGAGKQFVTDYPRYAKNVLAGFGQLGNSILSAPGNVRDYLAKKELISPESPSFRLPESILPRDYNYSEALGVEGHKPGDELIRSLPSQVASLPLFDKIFSAIESVPLTKGLAAKPLKNAQRLLEERGAPSLSISKDILKESQDFLPKNLPTKNLLKEAAKGDYKTLFSLQSDLGKAARELSKSSSGAERLHGFQAHDLRQRLLQGMKDSLAEQGHEDVANLLTKGQNKYRQHMKYRKPVLTTAVGLAGLDPTVKLIKLLYSMK